MENDSNPKQMKSIVMPFTNKGISNKIEKLGVSLDYNYHRSSKYVQTNTIPMLQMFENGPF